MTLRQLTNLVTIADFMGHQLTGEPSQEQLAELDNAIAEYKGVSVKDVALSMMSKSDASKLLTPIIQQFQTCHSSFYEIIGKNQHASTVRIPKPDENYESTKDDVNYIISKTETKPFAIGKFWLDEILNKYNGLELTKKYKIWEDIPHTIASCAWYEGEEVFYNNKREDGVNFIHIEEKAEYMKDQIDALTAMRMFVFFCLRSKKYFSGRS